MVVLLAALIILYSFQSLFLRLYNASRNGQGEMQFSVVYGLCAGICTLAINGFVYAPSWITVLLGVINAGVLLTYNISMGRAGSLGSYAFMMICVLTGGILVPMVYDAVYLKNSFNAVQLIAVALMIAAFIVLNLDGIKEKKSGKYLLFCVILFFANGAYGIFMNLQQNLMEFTQRNEMIITTFLGTGIVTAIMAAVKSPRELISGFRMSAKSAAFMMGSAISATIAVNMMLYAMKVINFTVLNVVANGGILVVSSVYAFVLFKEQATVRKLIGIAMACASIVMLSL
ncbi:MAG: hypothetical protein IJC56_04560 [Clostridia bacterium]|nr:hypothetical protein [Clostridia bacterium]